MTSKKPSRFFSELMQQVVVFGINGLIIWGVCTHFVFPHIDFDRLYADLNSKKYEIQSVGRYYYAAYVNPIINGSQRRTSRSSPNSTTPTTVRPSSTNRQQTTNMNNQAQQQRQSQSQSTNRQSPGNQASSMRQNSTNRQQANATGSRNQTSQQRQNTGGRTFAVFAIQNKTKSQVEFHVQWNSLGWKVYYLNPGKRTVFWREGGGTSQVRFYDHSKSSYVSTNVSTDLAKTQSGTPNDAPLANSYCFTSNGRGMILTPRCK